jgi:hypothetical protein
LDDDVLARRYAEQDGQLRAELGHPAVLDVLPPASKLLGHGIDATIGTSTYDKTCAADHRSPPGLAEDSRDAIQVSQGDRIFAGRHCTQQSPLEARRERILWVDDGAVADPQTQVLGGREAVHAGGANPPRNLAHRISWRKRDLLDPVQLEQVADDRLWSGGSKGSKRSFLTVTDAPLPHRPRLSSSIAVVSASAGSTPSA